MRGNDYDFHAVNSTEYDYGFKFSNYLYDNQFWIGVIL